MTAIVSFKSATEAYLATDTAHLHTDGTISHFASKAFALPGQALVFATQGFSRAPEILMDHYGLQAAFQSQASWLVALPDALKRARDCIRSHHPEREGTLLNEIHIWLAMFCETDRRPKLLTMTTCVMDYMPELSPYHLAEHDGLVTPPVDVQTLMAGWRGSPEEAAALILEAQRFGTAPWDKSVHIVGGRGELWTVSAQGVSGNVVSDWPEAIGERCNPRRKST